MPWWSRILLVALLCTPASAGPWRAELPPGGLDSTARVGVSAALSTGPGAAAPGGSLVVAVVLDHDPGWHTHTQAPEVPPELGDASAYVATRVEVFAEAPLRPHPGFTQWPEPEVVEVSFLADPVGYAVFGGRAVAYVPVTVAADAAPGAYPLRVAVTFQACDDARCLRPVRGAELALEVRVASDAPAGTPPPLPLFEGFDPGVWAQIHAGVAPVELPAGVDLGFFGRSVRVDPGGWSGFAGLLLLAALGGLLLNLTPCVLPVLPIKAMGLAARADSRGAALRAGGLTGLGVVGFWLAIGVAIASLTGFSAVHELFQRPAFTLGVGVVIAGFAVAMAGWFRVPVPRAVYAAGGVSAGGGWLGHVLLGVATAVLSTPCTAPFLGAAAAWAATQPAGVSLWVFGAIGAGMALPYVVLAAFPGAVAWVPRAGPGAVAVKRVMALAMLAAACWFLGAGLSALGQAGWGHAAWAAIPWLLAAAAGLAAYSAWRHARGRAWPVAFTALAALALAGAGWWSLGPRAAEPIDWVAYEPGVLGEVAAEGRVAVIDFTADWCMNCKALEWAVLNTDAVAGLPGVTFVRVDLTGDFPAGEALLAEAGRVAIPALLVRGPDGRETLNAEAYTAGQVVAAVERARAPG